MNNFTNSSDEIYADELNCKYYDITSFRKIKKSNKQVSLFHLNIASLFKHKDELETLFDMLEFNFDFIGLTETKIKNKSPAFKVELDGYHYFSTPTDANKGGAILYVKDHFTSKHRVDLEKILYKSKELESVFVEICNKNKTNFIVASIYRHPSMDLGIFNKEFLTPLFQKLEKEKKRLFLVGDLNVDLLKVESNTDTSDFFDSITSNLLVPHIIHPTRYTSHSKTLIDNIFSNCTNFQDGISGNLTVGLSDHLPQFLFIHDEASKSGNPSHNLTRDFKNFNRENFLLDFLTIDFDEILNHSDLNISFNTCMDQIDDLIKQHMPLRKLSKRELKTRAKPWITLGLRNSIHRRELIYKKFLKENDLLKKQQLEREYKTLRNHISFLCKQSKKLHFAEFFQSNSHNLKKTWNGIKKIININSKKSLKPTCLSINNKIIYDKKDMANSFNKFFTSIASKLKENIYNENSSDFNKYLKDPNDKTFFISPTNGTEILNIINHLNATKASGPDSIPYGILQLIKRSFSNTLSILINKSFENGIYFERMKTSKVLPLFKNSDNRLDMNNYRPISLLSNINKIFEKLMHSRLYSFLEKHKCIFNSQFGFRKNHSTEHALFSLTEKVRSALDKNEISCGIFIDLKKAFDTVSHSILLKKLDYYGIRGVGNDWFKSYLTNRNQFVDIDGQSSSKISIDHGVPQGSILGPLLFLIYINDLHKAICYSHVIHFADDTSLIVNHKSPKTLKKLLNKDLKFLCKWLKANCICLNTKKTELVIFHHPNKTINYNLKIKLHGKKLFPSVFVRYLGVLIDSHLNFSHHMSSIGNKLSRAIGMLSKIRHYVDFPTLRSIYFSIFSSILSYSSIIWGQNNNTLFKRIEALQNKAIKIINFANPRDSPSHYFKTSEILKIHDWIRLQNFLLAYDKFNNNLPTDLLNKFDLISHTHFHQTRISSHFNVILPKIRTTTYGLKSITFQSSAEWNFFMNLFNMHELHNKSRSRCKSMIKKYFIESY